MPFLDHLEELRSRLLKVLGAIVVSVGFGIWLVLNFGVIDALKAPIAPFLPDGNLTVLAVTEPFMITLKLGTVVGLVLASPIVLYQLWAFLSPALYDREKKAMIPALFVGLLLFLAGGWVGWAYIVPKALPILLGFQSGSFNIMITYQTYFSFVIQIIIALGLSAEVPLVMILLAALGIFDARRYNAFRRYAVLLSFIAGALMSPGGDVTLMILLTLPLLLLYELGVAGSYLVQRRARRAASIGGGALLLALAGLPGEASAQVPIPRGRQGGGMPGDTLRQRPGTQARQLDSAAARRLGLPTGPERTFPTADSVMAALLKRKGFATTRFLADTALLFADSTTIVLKGQAGTERDGAKLEGAQIVYSDDRCELIATGEPKMFEEGKIAIGRVLRFDTCRERGVIADAFTSFDELGTNWFVRGNLAVDSSAARLYAAKSEFTSCDLPVAHYHFQAGEVKWVSQSVLVARPAVLYIRDVPIVWLPFLFQDTKPGRRSGILIPQFGFNDIVRPTRGYRRQVTNIGYYWAPNEYIDLTARLDWFASRYVQYGAEMQYAWIDRFITGGIGLNRQVEGGGGSSLQFRWNHNQRFNAATTLVLNLDYATDSRIIAGNAVDPLLTTRQILSSVNFTKRFAWGQVTLGGIRRQSITDGSGTMTLPSLTVSPNPLDIAPGVTWSPGFSFTNESQFKTPQPIQTIITPGGLDSLETTGRVRNSTMSFDTPLRLGQFNWRNRIAVNDRQTVARTVRSIRIPDVSTPEPDDSITVSQVQEGDFSSGLDWDTSINLPIVASGSWKITPSVGVRNITSGPFLLRNAATRGAWVQQGKRLEFGLAASPTFYAFFNRSFGPVHRIRHRIAPLINFAWNPSATLPEEYARAISQGGTTRTAAGTPTPSRMTLAVGLNQNFEAKLRPATDDTTSDETRWRKVALLELTTSPVTYDFEQAKLPGRSGWVTQAMTNSIRSDLISGLQLSVTHDLWEGQVGTDTARFSPFLANVQANFSLTSSTFRSIGSLLGLGGGEATPGRSGPAAPTPPPTYMGSSNRRFRPGSFGGADATRGLTGGGFRTSVTYSLSRSRGSGPVLGPVPVDPGGFDDPFGALPITGVPVGSGVVGSAQSNLGFNASFSPTPFWAVSWQTQYNVTEGRFESQQIQLQRDLHDWRASFNFVRGANGNFALFFSVYLMNLPDIKFDYNQTTLQQ